MSNVAISIRGLHKAFGDRAILSGVDLDVYEAENVVVLGRSGSGKSVLIKIVVGLLTPDAGGFSPSPLTHSAKRDGLDRGMVRVRLVLHR